MILKNHVRHPVHITKQKQTKKEIINMNKVSKLVLTVLSVITVLSVAKAADIANFTIDSGYNNNYVVNGVTYAKDTPFVNIGAVKSLKYADVYIGGVLTADSNNEQSHWLVGAGKSVAINKDFSIRVDGVALRHQTSTVGIDNSTELGTKVALQNPWVTPYVRGSFNLELHQNAYFVGAERAQKLPFGFVLTPSVEWGKSTSYEAFNVKSSLTRPFTFAWGTLSPYAEVGWYNNNVFDVAEKTYALNRFDNDVVYTAGIKLSF